MRTFFSFLLALMASLFVSQIVAQMLAIQFKSREEFIAVMALLFLFAVVCIVILALVYAIGASVASLNRASLILSGLVIAVTAALTVFGMSQSNWAWPGDYDLKLIAEILFPALLVVAVQWALLHRRIARTSI
jgi:hypothetical protein